MLSNGTVEGNAPVKIGDVGHLKPVIDRLASIRPEFLAGITAIIERLVLLTEDVTGKPVRKAKRGANAKRPRRE